MTDWSNTMRDEEGATPLLNGYGGEKQEELLAEVKKQAWLSLPMIGVLFVQFAVPIVSVMFVGHLGELQLSSVAIANSICNVTGYSVMVGLANALETFCGQAYGAKQYTQLGIYLQRAVFVLTICALPISLSWIFMEHVLLFFGQDPEISKNAGVFALYLLPEMFAFAFLHPLDKFLQSQGAVGIMFMCSFFNLLLNACFCYVTVYKLGLGIKGAALSASLASWINVACLVIVVATSASARRCWGGLSREMFHDIKPFLKLAVPSALMICLEWWAFEILVLMSGLLPNPQLETSVFTIVLNTIMMVFILPYGLSTGSSIRISNELGAGNPTAAKLAFKVSMLFSTVNAILVGCILFFMRRHVGQLFSDEAEVIDYVAKLMPYVVLLCILDAFQGVVSGAARGCGWQGFAAVANLVALYVIGVPVAAVLAFVFHMKGEGFLIGTICGLFAKFFAFLTIAVKTDWKNQAEQAKERLSSKPLLLE